MTKQIDREKLITAIKKEAEELWEINNEPLASETLRDLVKAIEKGNFDAPEPEGWVSVKDKLPSHSSSVFCCEEKRKLYFIGNYYHQDLIDHWVKEEREKRIIKPGWYKVDFTKDGMNEEERLVTHWMELLELPTTESKDE